MQHKQAEELTHTPAQEDGAGAVDSPPPPVASPVMAPAAPAVQPPEADTKDIALVFAPGGPVARLLGDGYRPRRGQAAMARLVMQAVTSGQHALVEAGTGSGKSFAYLIPLLWTGGQAFVSTANKTLQNQLWEKDIPALRRIAPRPFTAALLKGRSNYLCRVKLKEVGQQLALPGHGLDVGELMARLDETPSGDVEELRLFGEQRQALTVGRHDCLGERCPMLSACYYEMARLWAEKADIVILNHALLALNMTLNHSILSPRDIVVIDEAQEFESYVVGALRLSLEYDQVPAFVNDAVVTRNADERIRGKVVHTNHELFTHLSSSAGENGERRWAAPLDLSLAQTLGFDLNAIRGQMLKRYPPAPGERSQENAQLQRTIEWAGRLADEILVLGRPVPDDAVRYCERAAGKTEAGKITGTLQARVALHQEPVAVAEFLREALWKATKTVICTTATLTVDGRFDHFCRQTGAPHEGLIQRVFDSPFDFTHQALLYTPHGLVPQYGAGEQAYVESLAAEVERLVTASRGRAFVLCTSTRRAGQLFDLLAPRVPYPCYCQGKASRSELLDLFQAQPRAGGAVLFATKSFWEGVDIPGEALSLVIIDKLPFAPHRDPVIQRREQHIRDAGGDPFAQLMLPEAILALKQGVGRLIRTETDRGVMAILDSRLNTKQYGAQVIASLPRARRTLRFEDVSAFFEASGTL